MKMKNTKKVLSVILCMVLVVAMALFTTGCGEGTNKETSSAAEKTTVGEESTTKETTSEEESTTDKEAVSDTESKENDQTDKKVLGEGKTVFDFTVVDKEGNETAFEIHTDKETVGEALTELELIEGEEGQYGLFVKTVNGITADYDKDGVYWAFYVNGEYAQTGVDSTKVTDGESYSFKVEK